MKKFLIAFLVVDLLLVGAAVLRFTTAVPTDKPAASAKAPSIGETGTGGDFVEGMRGRRRVDEIESTGTISTSSPTGNAGVNASGSLDRASAIEDNRENDLDDAKSKIGQIGK